MHALGCWRPHLLALLALVLGCQPIDRVVAPLDAGVTTAGRDAAPPEPEAGPPPLDAQNPPLDAQNPPPDAQSPPDPALCSELKALADLRVGSLPPALESNPPGFARAICSCSEYVGRGLLSTDAWDGSLGPYASDRTITGGDVGLNGVFNFEARAAIGGSLVAAGSGDNSLSVDVELEVGGDLGAGGSLQGAFASVSVGGNAAVAQRINLARLRVAGTLTQPAGQTLAVAAPPELGALVNEAVAIAPPCACAPGDVVDIAALVQVELPAATPVADLDCATFPAGAGPVVLYAAGSLQLTTDLVLGTGAGREVVLLVEGDLLVEGRFELGDPEAQRRVRLYVGGNNIQLRSGGSLSGSLYAPLAGLVLPEALTVYGALFVGRVSTESALTVHQEQRP